MAVKITRHYLTIRNAGRPPRRAHYRRAGEGPPLLLVHQSPRSSAEYEGLMREWGRHFTCIAPDTPGFGLSDPLPDPAAEIDQFADALLEFCDAAGLGSVAAYGFHSGGIILVTALKRHMARFRALAIGGYAVWNEAERARIGPPYIPPNPPRAYGEHLVWLWNRVLEQSWYFPWFEPADDNRLPFAHAEPALIDAAVQDLLDAQDHYRTGYGAVLRGPRDIPAADADTPPVLITAYQGDPLADHLERLGPLPARWQAYPVADRPAHWAASLEHLLAHGLGAPCVPREDCDAGFLDVATSGYAGLIHWRGNPASGRLQLHAPGRAGELVAAGEGLAIDLPGHGQSSGWSGPAPEEWAPWQAVIAAVCKRFGLDEVIHEPLPAGDPALLYPDLAPDRFGHYLTTAWAIVRASHIYAPWYEAAPASAIRIDPATLAPERLSIEHRALLRAPAARALHLARASAGIG